MSDSQIIVHRGSTTFAGPDATELFRATVLRSAIGLGMKGIRATRGFTLTKGLAMAERYTGKRYKRTQGEQAMADLTVWIETMKSALPVVRDAETILEVRK